MESDGTHAGDTLDLQLLQALQVDGRASFGLLGRVLGVSDQTVARRYARMRSTSGLRVAAADQQRQKQWYVRAHYPGRSEGHRSRRRGPP